MPTAENWLKSAYISLRFDIKNVCTRMKKDKMSVFLVKKNSGMDKMSIA